MRRMVYGAFAILLVVLLITTFWVTSLHNEYTLGLGSGYQKRTISIETYLSPDVSGDITLSARSDQSFTKSEVSMFTLTGRFKFEMELE